MGEGVHLTSLTHFCHVQAPGYVRTHVVTGRATSAWWHYLHLTAPVPLLSPRFAAFSEAALDFPSRGPSAACLAHSTLN